MRVHVGLIERREATSGKEDTLPHLEWIWYIVAGTQKIRFGIWTAAKGPDYSQVGGCLFSNGKCSLTIRYRSAF